jgi:hypothetical protein
MEKSFIYIYFVFDVDNRVFFFVHDSSGKKKCPNQSMPGQMAIHLRGNNFQLMTVVIGIK